MYGIIYIDWYDLEICLCNRKSFRQLFCPHRYGRFQENKINYQTKIDEFVLHLPGKYGF